MAINIIDGFFIGSSSAVDSRFSVPTTTDRDNILYKYDGLKVFVSADRVTYIWNSNTVSWDVDGSGTSGSGQEGYIARWSNSSTIGTSSIYMTASFVGINTTNPLSILQLNNGTSAPISLNVQSDSAVLGYNWYFNSGDTRFDALKNSTKLEMTDSTGMSVQVRVPSSGSWTRFFEVNNTSGYNYLRNTSNGNFISGSMSVNPSGTSAEYPSLQLMSVNGTFRTNSAFYRKVTYLTFTGIAFNRQNGFQTNGSYSISQAGVGTTNYNIQSNEDNIIVNSVSTSAGTLTLPTLVANSSIETGRQITIVLESTVAATMVISSATNIIGLNGSATSPVLRVGETITLMAFNNNTTTVQWKVVQYNNGVCIGGSQDDFLYFNSGNWTRENYTTHLITSLRGLSNTQDIRIRNSAISGVRSFLTLPSPTSGSDAVVSLQTGNLPSGARRLVISHSNYSGVPSGYSVIQNWGSGTGTDGSNFYIISNNSSTTPGGERVVIQTRELNIPGTGSVDPPGIGGSIQLAAKTSIDFISQTGAYYLGNRIDTLASTAILPTVRTGSTLMHYLLLDPNSGRIYRSSTTTNTI